MFRLIIGAGGMFWLLHFNFKMRHHRCCGLPQLIEHPIKQDKSFPLIFIERVFLGVRAQAHGLLHVIKRQQVIFPLLIQHLQEQGFFRHTHIIRADPNGLFRHFGIRHLRQAIRHQIRVHAVFFDPIIGRHRHPKITHSAIG